jgi:DNA invertase Pin-like site-specific DNA recombinase
VSTIAASYSRYSSDLQDSSSISQQQRKCRERAAQDGNTIPPDLEFADEAVSGTKRNRAGLNAMLAAAGAGRFGTIYFESLSRLARESVLTMPMLKELVYVHRVRIVSVSEGIDSSQNNWDLLANFMAWVHEQYLKGLRAAVLRGQEEAVLNDWSVGDWCFGYGSEPIAGSEKGRRGRLPRPRMRVIINEGHARWVRQIFHWFVEEKRPLDWITRELTRQNAPKDHRSTKQGWHHDYVKRVLRNTKYIGIWPWGRKTNVRNPLTGDIMQEERPIEEAAKMMRERPHLRIIDDATFCKAQALLDEYETKWQSVRADNGRLHGSMPDSHSARHLLQGLLRCASCGSTFQVSGAHGNYLGCGGYRRGLCSCKTRLPRQRAEVHLLAAISSRIFAQPEWLDLVVQEARRAWEQRQQQEPIERIDVERKLAGIDQMISRLIDAIECGDGEVDELNERVRQRRREKRQLEQQVACLRSSSDTAKEPPTREWVEAKLQHLHEVMRAGGSEANAVLRQLVGGQVMVEEATTPGRKRRHLVLRFTLSSKTLLADTGKSMVQSTDATPLTSEEVVVAIREEPPWVALAEEVKKRFDQGLEYDRIAEELQCHRTWVPKALAYWHQQRGLPVPDGRQLRARLQRPNAAAKLADDAKALWDEDLPMQEIAVRLGCDRDTVAAAIRCWFESRGLAVPDGRHRRKDLRLRRESQQISIGPIP